VKSVGSSALPAYPSSDQLIGLYQSQNLPVIRNSNQGKCV
jgi:hypothetical protein